MTHSSISLVNLSVGYRRHTLLGPLNLTAGACELVALVGRNGAGKSTLMRTVAGMQPPVAGHVEMAGRRLDGYSRSERAELMSIVGAETVRVPHLTVQQLVAYGRFPHTNWIGKLTGRDRTAVNEAMQLTGVDQLAAKSVLEISDGERQRVIIARTLAQDTRVMLLDEPAAFLDMAHRYEMMHLLRSLARTKQKTVVVSTHDLNVAMQEADRLWLIAGGAVHEGAPEDMALGGLLARMFDGSKLRFDDVSGAFTTTHGTLQPVRLAGEGRAFFWTAKMLERLGFRAVKAASVRCADVSIPAGVPARWTVHTRSGQQQFDSLYGLSQYLQEDAKSLPSPHQPLPGPPLKGKEQIINPSTLH